MLATDLVHSSALDSWNPGDRALIDFSIRIAAAYEEDELRRTLRDSLDLLARLDGGTHYAICEISVAPAANPLIVWQIGRAGFTIAENPAFYDWFARSRAEMNAFLPATGEFWCARLAGGVAGSVAGWESFAAIIVAGEQPNADRLRGLSLLADLIMTAFARLHRRQSESLNHHRLQSMNAEAIAFLGFGADILWQAGTDGVIRCCRVFNRRQDLASAANGMNLRELIDSAGRNMLDRLTAEASIRHLPVQMRNAGKSHISVANTLYISGTANDLNSPFRPTFAGSMTCTPRRPESAASATPPAAPRQSPRDALKLRPFDRAAHLFNLIWHPDRRAMASPKNLSVAALVERALAPLQPALESASIEIDKETDPDPAIIANAQPLVQVCTNLIRGAVEAISKSRETGEGQIRIRAFRAAGTPGEIILRIEDNGPGFSSAALEPAAPAAPSAKPAGGRTASDLATSHVILREFGGRLVWGNHADGAFVTMFIPPSH